MQLRSGKTKRPLPIGTGLANNEFAANKAERLEISEMTTLV